MTRRHSFRASLAARRRRGLAQNTNSEHDATGRGARGRAPAPRPRRPPPPADAAPSPRPRLAACRPSRPARAPPPPSPTRAVRDAFDTLIDGIRRADVDTVMGVYWNSPQLVLFNNNGTVTKSWEQVRANRQSSTRTKDVKLDVRDVPCARSARRRPSSPACGRRRRRRAQTESATGRLTLVFQRVGGAWKIVHTHPRPTARPVAHPALRAHDAAARRTARREAVRRPLDSPDGQRPRVVRLCVAGAHLNAECAAEARRARRRHGFLRALRASAAYSASNPVRGKRKRQPLRVNSQKKSLANSVVRLRTDAGRRF